MVMGLVAALMLLLLPAAALADFGPHGGYTGTNTPDGCAACHRAHTAQGAMLLKSDSVTALCTSCHGTAAAGAQTNVIDGVYAEGVNDPGGNGTGGGGLRAGGFVNTVMNTNFSGTATSHAAVSGHKVEGMTGTVAGTVWGYGPISATANQGVANVTLECTDCHNPHGNSGPNGAASYRVLRSAAFVFGSPSPAPTSTAWVEDTATKSYTINGGSEGVPNNYFYDGMDSYAPNNHYTIKGTVPDPDSTASPQATMTLSQEISYFCIQCHSRYSAKSPDFQTDSGDAVFHYRHSSRGASLNCLTCHVSHGSSADSTALAQSASLQGDGAMLRLDNRGVCANCHASEWVRGTVSGLTPATTATTPASASDTSAVYTIAGSGLTNKNAVGAELLGGKVKLTTGSGATAITKWGVVTGWTATQVTFTLPTGMTAGTWSVTAIPNGTRDSGRRIPLWPNGTPTTGGFGTLYLN